MNRKMTVIASLLMMGGVLAGCSSNSGTTSSATKHIDQSQAITQVYGDGQKVSALAIKYDSKIDASSLSKSDFKVNNHKVTGVYTNDKAKLTNKNVDGNYVIVKLSTSKINSEYTEGGDSKSSNKSLGSSSDSSSSTDTSSNSSTTQSSTSTNSTTASTSSATQAPSADSSTSTSTTSTDSSTNTQGPSTDSSSTSTNGPSSSSSPTSGGPQMSMGSNTISNRLKVTYKQSGDIKTSSGDTYSKTTKDIKTNYKKNINLIVDDFTQHTYKGSKESLKYNLYTPKNNDSNKKYPLVLFMPDATAVSSKDPVKTLTQGLGAVVWASPESQSKNPAYVLAPQYANGSADVDTTISLLKKIMKDKNVDKNRIYVTGQSAGTINAIQMMIENKKLFAGAMLVAGQADDAYTSKIGQLSGQNMWMVASTGDVRALPGMTAIEKAVKKKGTKVTEGKWSARLSETDQNKKVSDMEKKNTHVKYTKLNHVVPSGVGSSAVTEHLNTWRVAYSISGIRDWLFSQKK